MKKYNVAVVGATGNVGREILNILDFRNFPVNKVFALASSKSEGLKVIYGNDKEIEVSNLEKFDFKTIDIVLSSAGSKVSEKFSKKAIKNGSIIIDNTSHFRMTKDVPLIVPEVNPEELSKFKKKKNNFKPKLLNYSNGCSSKTNPRFIQNKKNYSIHLSINIRCWQNSNGRIVSSNSRRL